MTRITTFLSASLAASGVALLASSCGAPAVVTRPVDPALDQYLAARDPSLAWKLARTLPGDGWTAYVIDLTSQSWRASGEVDRTAWQHWLTIIKPNGAPAGAALLFLGGGDNSKLPPDRPGTRLLNAALASDAIAAEIGQVPNQPLVFPDGERPRWEDDLVLYTWKKRLQTGDAGWSVRLPMVKSAVRAMDAVQAFLRSDEGGKVAVDRFVLAGSSKRGWAALLAAAADPRVAASVSLVGDGINLPAALAHHHAAYGAWSPALGDFERNGLLAALDSPDPVAGLDAFDPFALRQSLIAPKLFINATGDEFFPPDSSRFYFDDLPGDKALRCVPNAKHNLVGSDATETVAAYFRWVAGGRPIPRLRWELSPDGALVVQPGTERSGPAPAVEARLWQATNPAARDFRLDVLGKKWTSLPLAADASGAFSARVQPPAAGWTAYFIELTYAWAETPPLKLTTAVQVTPEAMPHGGTGEGAGGRLRDAHP